LLRGIEAHVCGNFGIANKRTQYRVDPARRDQQPFVVYNGFPWAHVLVIELDCLGQPINRLGGLIRECANIVNHDRLEFRNLESGFLLRRDILGEAERKLE